MPESSPSNYWMQSSVELPLNLMSSSASSKVTDACVLFLPMLSGMAILGFPDWEIGGGDDGAAGTEQLLTLEAPRVSTHCRNRTAPHSWGSSLLMALQEPQEAVESLWTATEALRASGKDCWHIPMASLPFRVRQNGPKCAKPHAWRDGRLSPWALKAPQRLLSLIRPCFALLCTLLCLTYTRTYISIFLYWSGGLAAGL
jgi:hypothetical protein